MPHFDHALKVAHALNFATRLTMYFSCPATRLTIIIIYILEFDNLICQHSGIPYYVLAPHLSLPTPLCLCMVYGSEVAGFLESPYSAEKEERGDRILLLKLALLDFEEEYLVDF